MTEPSTDTDEHVFPSYLIEIDLYNVTGEQICELFNAVADLAHEQDFDVSVGGRLRE